MKELEGAENTASTNDIPGMTPERLWVLQKFFEPVMVAHGLRWVRDNIYVNERGRRFYLDSMGFHPTVLLGLAELYVRKKELDKRERRLDAGELGKKSRSYIRRILRRWDITYEEKVNQIERYINRV